MYFNVLTAVQSDVDGVNDNDAGNVKYRISPVA